MCYRSPVPTHRGGAFKSPSPQPPSDKPRTPTSGRLARVRLSAKTKTPIVTLDKNFALHEDLDWKKKTFDLEDEMKRIKSKRENTKVVVPQKSIDLSLDFDDKKENRPVSSTSRPSSRTTRPKSRTQSRAGSRAGNKAGSRPQSRAASNLSIFG